MVSGYGEISAREAMMQEVYDANSLEPDPEKPALGPRPGGWQPVFRKDDLVCDFKLLLCLIHAMRQHRAASVAVHPSIFDAPDRPVGASW